MSSNQRLLYYNTLADMLNIEVHALANYTHKKHRHLWKITNGQARHSFATAAVGTLDGLFTALSQSNQAIRPGRAGGLDLESVMAWYLYAQQQRQLTTPSQYTLQQAAVGQRPPDLYWRFSHLSWELWRTYAVVWALKAHLQKAQIRLFTGFPSFYDWGRVYGRIPSNKLPFGVGFGVAGLKVLLTSSDKNEISSGTNIDSGRNTRPAPDTAATGDDTLPDSTWESILSELSRQMTKATFNAWLLNARLLARNGNEYTIGVCNQYAPDWLQHQLHNVIASTVAAMTGQEVIRLRFVVVGG